ncbi:MAG: deoxyribose-phosphate aldolase, partial [Anaerolineae bacterium]|nr:deoxyribose-phosphate aldolase [Anaerolineae bacterium]
GFRGFCVLPEHTKTAKKCLKDADIKVTTLIDEPTGSSVSKERIEMVKKAKKAGSDEIDVVMNIGKLRSGLIDEVQADLNAVIEVINPLPVKVIIEVMYLTPAEIEQACAISVAANASFVKTGTGWADRATSLEDVKLIKSFVGEKAKIKASGGIRNLETLVAMYQAGARRFGVNLKSGISIVKECLVLPKGIEVLFPTI